MSITNTESQEDKVKLAFAKDMTKLIKTKDILERIDKVLKDETKNGTLNDVQSGFILDLLMEIQNNWKPTGKRIGLKTIKK